ncbi:hypothetical protein CDD81_6498 [Ophiocordyceps australis]|uniref:Cyanovirin-N domain-containing protein n=1 Tax=Ophiocordyceps australis TaxID=1399860 RepID=A0A2C5YIC2_9HYPO|nr:hypothetical protein CDD81_6498 [Ophiocordyceps australis]
MKGLLLAGLVYSLLIGLGAAALPSIHDCKRDHRCLADLLHFEGSLEVLQTQCQVGVYKEGTLTASISTINFRRLHPRCGRVVGHRYQFSAAEFRPVCNCIEDASLPRHCDSISCYGELLLMADSSAHTLRQRCLSRELEGSSPVTVSLSHFSSQPQCGSSAPGDMVRFSPEEYHPVCQCIVADEASSHIWPASEEAGSVDNVGLIYIDVFLHVVVKSLKSLRAEKFKQRGKTEDEFNYLLTPIMHKGIKFVIKSMDLTVDAFWASGRDNKIMRQTLHKGDNRDLNFYMVDELSADSKTIEPINSNTKVYCSPPPNSAAWREEQIGEPVLDGCIISVGMSPGNVTAAMGNAEWKTPLMICAISTAILHTIDMCQSQERLPVL